MTLALSQQQVNDIFDEMCREHRGELLRYARRHARTWDDAEDAVQQAFMIGLLKRDTVTALDEPIAWLMKTTKHTALQVTHHRQREIAGSDFLDLFGEPEPIEGDERCMADEETAAAVASVIESLPPLRRTAVELWCLHGFSWDEIAEYMDVPVPAAQKLVFRTLERLRAGAPVVEGRRHEDVQAEILSLIAQPRLLRRLDQHHRQILAMRFVECLKVREIAARLGVNTTTATRLLTEARDALLSLSHEGEPA
ncbi:sigma-70 family RNA polymerase sigma factor [Dactylosporangium sp. CA-139066]|uniref:sigma-70 family RNA polymerase sigma factor n=1 Tax=Dactylosporangium sp. CA-139066 TaxID=3239930 RepID=UPI003D91B9DB